MQKTSIRYNFSAGPAMLPASVLAQVQSELCDWQGSGLSVMEVGHRTPMVQALFQEAEASLRDLLSIPDSYHVLFLGGAARTHFSMIPMNFLEGEARAGYIVSGLWSNQAFDEASRLRSAYCIATTTPPYVQTPNALDCKPGINTGYVYYTPNETVNGVRFNYCPDTHGVPLIADMTSCLLSEPLDVSRYDLIFAGTQKNMGAAGMSVVIIRDQLLNATPKAPLPKMMDYRIHCQHRSLYATPPVFNCYVSAKIFDWVKAEGGVQALYQKNRIKANTLYQYIDASDFYNNAVVEPSRSLMNVCFSLPSAALEQAFVTEAEQAGFVGLRGHRSVGGLRASLYNAMPLHGVDALIEWMDDFSKKGRR